jgi:hypothetical protein
LFESLSQEQQQAFVTQFLNPAQAAVFAEFLDTYEKRKRALTSKDAKGPVLNLSALFDKRTERLDVTQDPIDARLQQRETKVRSFRDAFKSFVPFKNEIAPSKKQP